MFYNSHTIKVSNNATGTYRFCVNVGYIKLESTFCMFKYGSFPNTASAIKACNEDARCGYVYDRGCDNDGTLMLCPSDTHPYHSENGHCLYGRTGIFTTHH